MTLATLDWAIVTAYVLFKVTGCSVMSERWDQDHNSVTCETSDGDSFELKSDYYYEKYGGIRRRECHNLDRLTAFLTGRLKVRTTEKKVAGFVRAMLSHFGY